AGGLETPARLVLGVFVLHRASEHEAALGTKNERRAAQERLWRCPSHGFAHGDLAGNGEDTGLDALSVWQQLPAHSRARTIRTDQNIARCSRSVVETRRDCA